MYVMRKILLNIYGSQINYYLHQKHQNVNQTIQIHSHTFCHIHIQSLKFSLLRTRAVTPFTLSNLVQIQDCPFLVFLKTPIGPLIYGVVHTFTTARDLVISRQSTRANLKQNGKHAGRKCHASTYLEAHICTLCDSQAGFVADQMMKDQ
ncbi:Hypothetical_protein [Hexamita inflata]|uniref:Hypothetical_protein n=1 Tax=Hexamita inflata TaxID=28002 RepID=A0AA86PAT3_9EUKA|nr:Hypothetical protein HINF_LOCUS23104 [Hexamita inflata]